MSSPARAPARSPARRAAPLATTLCAAALATAALGSTATAAEAPGAVRVPYGDLNLSSDAGMQALLHRLSAASHRLCDDSASRELRRVVRAETCFRETLDNAVVAVHNERLSALYRGRATGGAT
jgi:UrcA family protein